VTRPTCGYFHAVCPATYRSPFDGKLIDHPYKGISTCDTTTWGSHGLSLAYLSGLTGCRNCGEGERQEILINIANDIVRSPPSLHALTPGAGFPDLSSRGLDGDDSAPLDGDLTQ
jgi:hypothetical protein